MKKIDVSKAFAHSYQIVIIVVVIVVVIIIVVVIVVVVIVIIDIVDNLDRDSKKRFDKGQERKYCKRSATATLNKN